MDNGAEVQSLIEEVLNSGRSPEEVCTSHPQHLEQVRRQLLRIRVLASDLKQMFPSAGADSAWAAGGAPRSPTELPRIPGYEVEGVIGHGGMGVVYKAKHLKLERTVAVKMLLAGDYAPAKHLEGLLREARSLAGLGHPNIVEVYEAGEFGGLPYFSMAFLEGGSLAQKLAGVPMPPHDAAVLVERLAGAVQAAHDKGIVHRDLKPANVLLTADGTPKVTDFGLARRIDEDTQGTIAAARHGTPSYMSPEQALGTPEALHPLVDVYSLGATLYETLTGRPPFRSDSPLETQRQVVFEEPVPPSRINRRVPQDLETICLKCLQKKPSARYATAGELGRDLRRYLDGEPIAARKTGAVVRTFKWMRRHPATTSVLGSGLLLLVTATVGVAWYLATNAGLRSAVESELAEVERAQRAADWATAKAALDRAAMHLGTGGPRDLRSRLDAARENAGVVTRLEAIRMARALAAGVSASFETSNRDYAAAYEVAGVRLDADPPDESGRRIGSSPISAALIAGMYDWIACSVDPDRRDRLLAVLRIVDSDHGGWRDRSRDPAVWQDASAVRRVLAEFTAEGQSAEFAMWFANQMRLLGHDPTQLFRQVQAAHRSDFWANFVLADTLLQRGQPLEALRFSQAAVSLRPDLGVAHDALGAHLRALYRFDDAISELQEAVRLSPSPLLRANLGTALRQVGRYREAMEQFEMGLREWPDDAVLHLDLGLVLADLDQERSALEHFKKAALVGLDSQFAKDALIIALVRIGQGQEAVATVRSWLGANEGNFERWDGLAELCLFVGATEDYGNIRQQLLDRFGLSPDPVVCEKMARACMLAPVGPVPWAAASTAIDRALASEARQPTWRMPYFKLAKALAECRGGHAEAALALVGGDVAKVLRPMPQLVAAMALSSLHRDQEALSALSQAATMFDWRPSVANDREARMYHVLRREAESMILPNLDAFTRGAWWPTTAEERLACIGASEGRGMPFATARLFAEAFARSPALLREVEGQCRYRAACAAAMSSAGRADAASAATEDRARWLGRSYRWLQEEFAGLREGAIKPFRTLARWRTDPDLRSIRDPEPLGALTEDQRAAFRTFWSGVDKLLALMAPD